MLEELKREYTEKYKRLALLDCGIDYTDIDTYVKYLTSDDEKQIKQQAEELAQDIDAHNTAKSDVHHDKQKTLRLFD